MPLTAHKTAESAYSQLTYLFPKRGTVRDSHDFWHVFDQTISDLNGLIAWPVYKQAPMRKPHGKRYFIQFNIAVFGDEEEDVFVVAVLDAESGEFAFYSHEAITSKQIPTWLENELTTLITAESLPLPRPRDV